MKRSKRRSAFQLRCEFLEDRWAPAAGITSQILDVPDFDQIISPRDPGAIVSPRDPSAIISPRDPSGIISPRDPAQIGQGASTDGLFMIARGDTLIVAGDARDNRIDIVDQGSRGVHVTIDGQDGRSLQDIRRIVVIGGDGDDVVDYTVAAGIPLIRTVDINTGRGNDRVTIGDTDPPDPDMTSDDVVDFRTGEGLPLIRTVDINTGAGDDVLDFHAAEGLPLIRTLRIATGAGKDSVSVNLGDADPPSERVSADPPGSIEIDTGGGDDVVDFRAAEGIPLIRAVAIDLGAGNDRLSLNIGDSEPPIPDVDPPHPDMPEIRIAAGAGDDVVDGNLAKHPDLMSIDLGTGNDRLSLHVNDVGPPSPDMPTHQMSSDQRALIFIDGGAGSDSLDISFVDLRIPGSLTLDVQGGADNDVIRTDVKLNGGNRGRLVARVFGNAGDDNLGLTVSGIGALDAVFAQLDGGPGVDTGWLTHNVKARNLERAIYLS